MGSTPSERTMLTDNFFWLFPTVCFLCHQESDGGIFCKKCFLKVTLIEKPYCQKCGKLFSEGTYNGSLCTECYQNERIFDLARSLFLYNCGVRKLIVHIKQTGNRNMVKKFCEMLVIRYSYLFSNIDVIIPVPSHWSRILFRGFNPADVIVWGLHEITGIALNRCLKRVRYTKYQHKKSKIERIKNVRNAFSCSWCGNTLRNVLLVDDVMTTGSTLNECSKVLKDAGAKKIHCVTIASTEAQ